MEDEESKIVYSDEDHFLSIVLFLLFKVHPHNTRN